MSVSLNNQNASILQMLPAEKLWLIASMEMLKRVAPERVEKAKKKSSSIEKK
jgi:hypothetical protein